MTERETLTVFVNPVPLEEDEPDKAVFRSKEGTLHDILQMTTKDPSKLPDALKKEIGDWKPVRAVSKNVTDRVAKVFVDADETTEN